MKKLAGCVCGGRGGVHWGPVLLSNPLKARVYILSLYILFSPQMLGTLTDRYEICPQDCFVGQFIFFLFSATVYPMQLPSYRTNW